MAVAAGVVGGAQEAAGGIVAPLEVAAQGGGAAQHQGAQHGLLHQRQRGLVGIEKRAAEAAHDFGDFQNRF